MSSQNFPIGVFDSGMGGLTVLKEIVKKIPQYDYIYLGDNARTPYGSRSFETVHRYTLECVKALFAMNCHLVILACNTASAKALRNIQQIDLHTLKKEFPERRVLGVIRPTTEAVGNYSKTKHVGILGTVGTVASESYKIEIEKFFPEITVFQEACPMWVSLVENNEMKSSGADFFIKKNIDAIFAQSPKIDTIILGCTHYPLLMQTIKKYVPENVTLLSQGEIVADSLADYLKRHTEIENTCSRNGNLEFYTTDSTENFDKAASIFFGEKVNSKHLEIHS